MIYLTRAQLQEIDRRALEEYHVPGIVLMENAARAVAKAACDMLRGECCGEVLVLCGGGNNGGDGLAVARHLHNRGAEVIIGLTVDPSTYHGDALINWKIIQAMKIPAKQFQAAMLAEPCMLVVDAIFGTGLDQPPRAPFDEMAEAVNQSGRLVLAIDVPSGLDCDTGNPLGACIIAHRTLTLVAQKTGFTNSAAKRYLGEVLVGDIGCPRALIASVHGP